MFPPNKKDDVSGEQERLPSGKDGREDRRIVAVPQARRATSQEQSGESLSRTWDMPEHLMHLDISREDNLK